MAKATLPKKDIPSLKVLLERRGIKPDSKYGDYQGYIEAKSKSVPTGKVSNGRVVSSGSMHVALGRFINPFKF